MELLYQNSQISICFLPQKQIIKAIWTKETQYMNDSDFQESIQNIWKNVRSKKPIGFLGDTRLFFFIVSPNLQNWYGENIGNTFGTGTNKIAMLVTSEFIAQVSIEQTIEEDKSAVKTRYFDSEEKAITWLLA